MKNTGITIQASTYSVKETIDRLQTIIEKNGATVYARIDQQAELRKVGITIHALEFILFGNPAAVGRLITENPVIALDLPLKVIAWEDEQQQVWLAYNEASYLQERYDLKLDSNSPLHLEKLISRVLSDGTK